MRAGRLDRQITIQRRTLTYSDSGEPQESWAPVVSRRSASVAPLQGDERSSAAQWIAKEQVEFRIRWSASVSDISPLDRVVYPTQSADSPDVPVTRAIFDIMAVHEIGRREGLQILAARSADAQP
jgi:head-tail adaptor